MQLVDHMAEDDYMMGGVITPCDQQRLHRGTINTIPSLLELLVHSPDLSIYWLKAEKNGCETELLYNDIGLGPIRSDIIDFLL